VATILATGCPLNAQVKPCARSSALVTHGIEHTLDISLAQKILRTRLRSVDQVLIDFVNA
jgi:hypothetical protein